MNDKENLAVIYALVDLLCRKFNKVNTTGVLLDELESKKHEEKLNYIKEKLAEVIYEE